MTTFTVVDRMREIEFSGKMLGSSTTENDDSLRWTEINIYRTDGGNYIVERLGRSLIYHRASAPCRGDGWVEVAGNKLPDESEPCPSCKPKAPEDSGFVQTETFYHETTKSSAEVVKRPEDLHDALSFKDDKRRVSRISHPAAQALQNAAANDPDLLQAIIRRVRVE